MSWSRRRLLASMLATSGCGLRRFPFDHGVSALQPDSLEVQYIGVGCCLVRWRSTAVLSDPFWSHLPIGRVLFGSLDTDPEQVDDAPPGLERVQAVVIGHGHYDHVLDLPWVSERIHPQAQILCSQSVVHQYAAARVARPMVAAAPGTWWHGPDGRLRVLPLRSDHPPQYAGIHLYRHSLEAPATHPPRRVGDFQEGETLAYLVDLLDDRHVAHRVYIETSSTGPPAGRVPDAVLEEHPVDVALVAMDTARLAMRGRPSILDQIQPRHVVLLHWENFFRSKDKPPREGMKVHLSRTRRRLVNSPERTWYFPSWNARLSF